MANLEIFVLILGDSPASINMFPVEAHDGTVGSWKGLVYANKQNRLKGYDAAGLHLWKLNKPITLAEVDEQESTWPLEQDLSSIAVEMLPAKKLSHYFPVTPMEESLHVIVSNTFPVQDSKVLPIGYKSPENRKRIREDEEPRRKRTRAGCITCRVRGKKCDEKRVDNGESCATCHRLKLHCLGFHERRPDWLRTEENINKLRKRMKEFHGGLQPGSDVEAFLTLNEMRRSLDATPNPDSPSALLQDHELVMAPVHPQSGRSSPVEVSAPSGSPLDASSQPTSRRSTKPRLTANACKERQVPDRKTEQSFMSTVRQQDMNFLSTAFATQTEDQIYGAVPSQQSGNSIQHIGARGHSQPYTEETLMDRHTSAGRMEPCPPSTSTGLATFSRNVTNAGQHYHGVSHQPFSRLPPQSPQPQGSDQLPSFSTHHSDADGVLPSYHVTGPSTSRPPNPHPDTGHQSHPTEDSYCDPINSNDPSMTRSPSASTLLPSGPHDESTGSHSLLASTLPSHVPEDEGDGATSGAISPTTRLFLELVDSDSYDWGCFVSLA